MTLAAEESAKSKAAKDVIKSLTAQVIFWASINFPGIVWTLYLFMALYFVGIFGADYS